MIPSMLIVRVGEDEDVEGVEELDALLGLVLVEAEELAEMPVDRVEEVEAARSELAEVGRAIAGGPPWLLSEWEPTVMRGW